MRVVGIMADEKSPEIEESKDFEIHPRDLPDFSQIEPAKNKESLYIHDDHEGKQIKWIQILECPCVEACSSQSWGRADCWSLESVEKVLSYLMHHLKNSEKHKMDETEAYSLLIDKISRGELKWKCSDYDWESRQYYRMDVYRKNALKN